MVVMKLDKIKEWKNPHKDGKLQWYVTVDGTEAVCYSEKVKEFKIGDDIPGDWRLEGGGDGKPPMLKAPGQQKQGGFQSAWRNSEAGERFNQDQMNRRTALMQAVAMYTAGEWALPGPKILEKAQDFYEYLRFRTYPAISAPPNGAPKPNLQGEPQGGVEPKSGTSSGTVSQARETVSPTENRVEAESRIVPDPSSETANAPSGEPVPLAGSVSDSLPAEPDVFGEGATDGRDNGDGAGQPQGVGSPFVDVHAFVEAFGSLTEAKKEARRRFGVELGSLTSNQRANLLLNPAGVPL